MAAFSVLYHDLQYRRSSSNSGFLFEGQEGWRPSPAYDLNSVPVHIKPRSLATAFNEDDATASMQLAMEIAGYFEMEIRKAKQVTTEVGRAVSKWRNEAAHLGLSKSEVERMASAFDHQDLRTALGK